MVGKRVETARRGKECVSGTIRLVTGHLYGAKSRDSQIPFWASKPNDLDNFIKKYYVDNLANYHDR